MLTTVARMISDTGIELDDLAIRRPSLDDVFLALTGHAAEEVAGDTGATDEGEAAPSTKRASRRSKRAEKVA